MLTGIVTTVMQIIPFVGFMVGLMMACLVPLAWFGQAMLLLYYGFQAYKGRRFRHPRAGQLPARPGLAVVTTNMFPGPRRSRKHLHFYYVPGTSKVPGTFLLFLMYLAE